MKFEKKTQAYAHTAHLVHWYLFGPCPIHARSHPFVKSGPCLWIKTTQKYHFFTISAASNAKKKRMKFEIRRLARILRGSSAKKWTEFEKRHPACTPHTCRADAPSPVCCARAQNHPVVGPEPSPWIISTQEYHFLSHFKGFKCKKDEQNSKNAVLRTHRMHYASAAPAPVPPTRLSFEYFWKKIKRFKNASNWGISLMTSSTVNGLTVKNPIG